MRRRTSDTLIASALSDLDPASRTTLTEQERDRADAAFARIVATPPGDATLARPRRPRRRLLATLGLAGAASIAIPGLLLGGSAFGSWTPTPEPLTGAAATAAATTCRAGMDAPDRGERLAVAERRGGWSYVMLVSPGREVICLMPDDLVGEGDPSGRGFFGSYDPDAPTPPTLAPDRIDENTSMEGSTDEGWFVWTEGYVGSEVTGVTVRTGSGLVIEASVTGGRFAAWWPATEQSSDQPAETWSYTVHLADGTTRRAP